ncbi:hypothetical protein BIU82_18995 [Arthrobacter sp. SW1]|uniref:hypothetical protein n=1 Tax=Arthrobacter sp. SW1 TaxID=1920889 RepID=UPI000877DBE4|nr:hypothetical protein [Arthrobacter sp. SW1]OFI37564.1 hypothetical protein BIU82_18995 [Arthrobacter sp. SW1]
MEFPQATFLSSPSGSRADATAWELHHGYKRGRLVRIRHGVYLPAEQWLSVNGWERYALTTASLAIRGESPVFCRETGLLLWGVKLAGLPQAVEYLTSHRDQLGRAAPPRLYGNRDAVEKLGKQLVPDLSILPTGFRDAKRLGTSAGRWSVVSDRLGLRLRVQDLDGLLSDTIHRLPFRDAVVVLDQLLPKKPVAHEPAHQASVHHKPAAAYMRSVEHLAGLCSLLPKNAQRERMSAALTFADSRSESVGESLSRAVIAELGFEVPELQFRVMGPFGEVARTDFHWRQRKLVGEFDGRIKYTRARELSGKSIEQVVAEEKAREDRIRALGYSVVRWEWDELMQPGRLATKLLRAGVPRVPQNSYRPKRGLPAQI